jgi:hypothetical protein
LIACGFISTTCPFDAHALQITGPSGRTSYFVPMMNLLQIDGANIRSSKN